MSSGIYQIRNESNNNVYIGSSLDLNKRKNSHFSKLRRNKHHCSHLQYAYNYYGNRFFKFEVIEFTKNIKNREQYYLDKIKNKYNILKKAYSVSGKNHPMFGKQHTKQSIHKIKEARKKQKIKHSKETKNKIGLKRRGLKLSEETKNKISLTKINNKNIPWNKGLKYKDNKIIRTISKKLIKKVDELFILKEYKKGKSINSIAIILKCSWDVVKRILKTNNIKIRNISEQKIILDKQRKIYVKNSKTKKTK